MRLTLLAVTLLTSLATGCTPSPINGPTDGSTRPTIDLLPSVPPDFTVAPPPPDLAGVDEGSAMPTDSVLDMPKVALAPGTETTMCVEIPFNNTVSQLVTHIHVKLAPGSHHAIVYRSNAAQAQPMPTPCAPLAGIQNGTAPIFIAQASESDLTIPNGVGIHLNPHQMIRLEEHFLNASNQPIQGTARFTLTTVPEGGAVIPADLIFWGTAGISIPPMSKFQTEMFHVVQAGVKIFGLTTHEHHFGTLATISRATSPNAPATELYANTSWSEPPLKQFAPPLAFDGTTGLKLHCEWNNTSNAQVTFGESAATNEMCFFWAYYYPSHGFDEFF